MADLFRGVLKAFDRAGLWHDGVELIGSWSFLLYQRHFGVKPLPLRTHDIDFLLPRPYPRRNAVDLKSTLAPLGFEMDFDPSGAARFVHPDLRIEFLTPERGKGGEKPREIRALGIKATQLRFLDMLFQNPATVVEAGITLKIPKPLNFCLHKLIVAQRRTRKDKREKDIEQAVYVLAILDPDDFLRAASKLPAKWKTMMSKSLAQAARLFPLETSALGAFFNITPHSGD